MEIVIDANQKADCVNAILKFNSCARADKTVESLTAMFDRMIEEVVQKLEADENQRVSCLGTYGFNIVGMVFPEKTHIHIECLVDPFILMHPDF